MDAKIRMAQIYELQRVALINVNYYGTRIGRLKRISRIIQIIAALAASGTLASVIRDVPTNYRWLSIAGSAIAALFSAIVASLNLTDRIAILERMHSAYKMLYHSTETLAKHTIGAIEISPEQEAVASMLEFQLAALGPQDEIDPNRKVMAAAQKTAEKQLPNSYFYPDPKNA